MAERAEERVMEKTVAAGELDAPYQVVFGDVSKIVDAARDSATVQHAVFYDPVGTAICGRVRVKPFAVDGRPLVQVGSFEQNDRAVWWK